MQELTFIAAAAGILILVGAFGLAAYPVGPKGPEHTNA